MDFFVVFDLEIGQMTWKCNRAPLLCYFKHSASFHRFKHELQSENVQFMSKLAIFCHLWPSKFDGWPWKKRAPLLCYLKLCPSFYRHLYIKTAVTVWKCSIEMKINNFFRRVTLAYDGLPKKTIRHTFYANSSFVNHFIAVSKFKLEL